MDIFEMKGQRVKPGDSAVISFRIARLPTHTQIDLPVYIFRGAEAGPVLLLTAGLHGNEINGIEIVRKMISEGSVKPSRGTVVAIPIVNIYGFLQSERYLPDGKDLNRSFPGNQTGSLAQRVAWVLMNEIIPKIDFGIDFHTGGASLSNFPQIRCDFEYGLNLDLAKMFAPPFIMNSAMINKSLRRAAHRIGKHIVVYEGGESLRFDDFAISEGVSGTLRMMKALQMIDDAPQPAFRPKILSATTWIRARYAGIFHTLIQPGDILKRNQLIGTITDPFGETTYPIKTREGGHVICLNNMPVLNAGDAIAHIGKEKQTASAQHSLKT
ncbi:MAG: succinylglutamate desuccinylase/aspartoacylase family protein [Balneolales bacterium]|nr:succinylglutamate desuccinylase/aspartoacylase family protein [Balneolales bacterium]